MNPFQQFLAARAAKGNTPPVVNQSAPVSRDEFNTLSRAVAALIEDFDTVASPDKIKSVVNEAFVAATKNMTTNAGPARTTAENRAHLAPKDDPVDTAPARSTAPVANGRNRAHLAPQGE